MAAAIGGVGWGVPGTNEMNRPSRPGRLVAILLAGPLANFALGALGLGLFIAAGGDRAHFTVSPSDALHGQVVGLPADQLTALLFGLENLAMGFLSFIPLPPLEGSRVMFTVAPRTIGWQKAQYRLVEQNWGVGILLVLLIVPFSSQGPLMLVLLNAIISPILTALA